MKLNRLTERIWIFPFEKERDRPNLGYIRGDRWSLAVDAGHSQAHTADFYRALEAAGLPLPDLTVLTHWHWDHTFGMHAVHGLCLANARTNRYLADFRARVAREGTGIFFALDPSIPREYDGGRPVVITTADLVFSGALWLDAGNCPIRVFQAEAPHTDDSTLVYAAGERILFLGDADGGTYPDWKRDPALCRKLGATVAGMDVEKCVYGHWVPETKREVLAYLAGEE